MNATDLDTAKEEYEIVVYWKSSVILLGQA